MSKFYGKIQRKILLYFTIKKLYISIQNRSWHTNVEKDIRLVIIIIIIIIISCLKSRMLKLTNNYYD